MKSFYVQWRSTISFREGFQHVEAPDYQSAIEWAKRTFAPYIEVIGVVESISLSSLAKQIVSTTTLIQTNSIEYRIWVINFKFILLMNINDKIRQRKLELCVEIKAAKQFLKAHKPEMDTRFYRNEYQRLQRRKAALFELRNLTRKI